MEQQSNIVFVYDTEGQLLDQGYQTGELETLFSREDTVFLYNTDSQPTFIPYTKMGSVSIAQTAFNFLQTIKETFPSFFENPIVVNNYLVTLENGREFVIENVLSFLNRKDRVYFISFNDKDELFLHYVYKDVVKFSIVSKNFELDAKLNTLFNTHMVDMIVEKYDEFKERHTELVEGDGYYDKEDSEFVKVLKGFLKRSKISFKLFIIAIGANVYINSNETEESLEYLKELNDSIKRFLDLAIPDTEEKQESEKLSEEYLRENPELAE